MSHGEVDFLLSACRLLSLVHSLPKDSNFLSRHTSKILRIISVNEIGLGCLTLEFYFVFGRRLVVDLLHSGWCFPFISTEIEQCSNLSSFDNIVISVELAYSTGFESKDY